MITLLRSEVREDAQRLLEAGADGFQIDSIYLNYFGRANVWSAGITSVPFFWTGLIKLGV